MTTEEKLFQDAAEYSAWMQSRNNREHALHVKAEEEAYNRHITEMRVEELEKEVQTLNEHHQRDEALIVQRTDEIRWHEKENARLRAALHEIAYLQSVWPRWEYQDLYESSRGMANEALANAKAQPDAQNL